MMVALLALLLYFCSAVHQQIAMNQPVDLTIVKPTMSKAEVKLALNKKPDNIMMVSWIARRKYRRIENLLIKK